jgi:glycosyltransferase involved in cell wall biosynthesis
MLLADRIATLYRDPKHRTRMGAAGRKAVVERYNWDHAGRELLGLYEHLEKD